MPDRPKILVFDVNETLSDMAPMAGRFEDVGAPGHLAKLWFAELLRDGFAVTVAGDLQAFATLGAEALRVRLSGQPIERPLEEAVDHVMQGFSELSVHPDVVEGVRALEVPAFSVQYHPEAAPGPHDATGLFAQFADLMTTHATGKGA